MRKILSSILFILASTALFVLYFADPYDFKYKTSYLVVGFISLIFATILLTTMFYNKTSKKIKWLENRLDAWNNISYHVEAAGDQAFNELPIGIIVYNQDFIIKWANKNIKQVFANKLIDVNLNEIAPEIPLKIRSKENAFVYKLNDKYYEIVSNQEHNILYFFDQTKRELLNIRYNNRITAFIILSVDNLEESIKRYDMQEQSNIRGQILGEIADYAEKYDAYLQSYNDRLVLICDQEHLNKMIEDKFDVLNDIRNVSQKNHLKTTASIGVACYDCGYEELGTIAQQALELAEKRGGDQAVVNIQNKKIQYFGAKTNALEKNTFVNARIHASAIREAIEASSNVIVMGHRMADTDAIAATLLMIKLVKSVGKPVKGLYNPSNVDSTVRKFIDTFLAEKDPELIKELVPIEMAEFKPKTLLIVVDTQSPTIVMYPSALEKATNLVVIDHHRHGEQEFVNPSVNYVEPYASSTVELISELFMFFGDNVEITPALATMALAGMVVDTNNFTYRTGSRTFEAASLLKDYDGDMAVVKDLLRDPFDIETYLASAVASAKIVFEKFAIVKLPDVDVVPERQLLAKISDRLLTIANVQASFTIGYIEKSGFVGVSARSLDKVNVQVIMEQIGGGGHLNAAAYQEDGTTIDIIYNKIVEILKREYDDGGEMMKVILSEDVKGHGKKNQIIDVANGYGNYLITNNLAVVANESNIKALEELKAKEEADAKEHKALMEKLKAEIDNKPINIYIKLGADGKLFGHITTKQICDEFEAQTGIKIDKRKVELPSEIVSVGIYQASVILDKDVVANIEINVLEK